MFSNLRNDAIRVENGSLQRGLLSISCSDSSDTVNLLPRMQFSWKFAEMPEALVESYDPSLQQAIALYRQSVNVRVLLSSLSLERHRPPPHRRHCHAAPAPQARAPAPRPPRRRHRGGSTFPRRIGLPRSSARGGSAQPVHQRARLAVDADQLPRAGSLRAVAGGNSVPLALPGGLLCARREGE